MDDSPWGDVLSNSQASHKPLDEDGAQNSKNTNSESEPSKAPAAPAGARRGQRGKRTPAPAAKLEAVDDPLGPLGSTAEPSQDPIRGPVSPPGIPSKQAEQPQPSPQKTAISPPPSRGRPRIPAAFRDDEEEDAPRARQPLPHGHGVIPRVGKQSMSVEQASKPSFIISVGDPHKVGDLTGSHTVYQVRTRTTSKAYRNPEFEVSRRYRDFLWLYNQLHSNNPGIVVPPPPEKQITNRFETNFVESRRAALEKMLQKTAQHPILQHDGDLKLFLESESFNIDKKDRKDPDLPSESKGMFSSLNLSVGSSTKFIEHDDWFLDRRVYLDTLESQLKALQRACETAVEQRKSLAAASGDLANSLNTLAQVEISPALSGPLASLSDVELRIRDLYDRQAQQDVLTLGIVIDEYIRLIGSIKKAFDQRQRSWQSYHNAESDLAKRRTALDKLMRQGRTQQDKMQQLQADVGDAERRCHQMRLQFEDLGRLMRQELERFEREKVEDFKNGVETYLEGAVEAQKELIELWESYLALLDADEEEEASQAKTGANIPVRPAPASRQPTEQQPQGQAAASTTENERPGTAESLTPPPTARSVEQGA